MTLIKEPHNLKKVSLVAAYFLLLHLLSLFSELHSVMFCNKPDCFSVFNPE